MMAAPCRRAALALLAGLALGLPAAGAETPSRPEQLKLGSLDFTPPLPDYVVLHSGPAVFFVENHDLPICDLTVQFRMGRRSFPGSEHACLDILGAAWRSGGTASLPPDSLDNVLSALDASISSWVDEYACGVSVSLAAADLEKVLPIWRDVALFPRFDPERVRKARADHLKDLQAINNDPDAIARHRMDPLLLGADNPEAHFQTRAECEAATREKLIALHRRLIHQEIAYISASGDFDRERLFALLEELFRRWQPSGPGAAPLVPADAHPQPGVYLLPGDYEQSQVRIGRITRGLTWSSPEYPAASILSFAFGYGRVFYRVRAEGLSYGATVMVNPGHDFTVRNGFGSCRGDVTVRFVRTLLAEADSLKKRPLTADELETARTFQVGRVVRGFETADDIVLSQVNRVVNGEMDDVGFLAGLRKTSLDDLGPLADRCVMPKDSLVVLVVGNPKTFDAPLDSLGLGPVHVLAPVEFGK